jgi:hypothetical protein
MGPRILYKIYNNVGNIQKIYSEREKLCKKINIVSSKPNFLISPKVVKQNPPKEIHETNIDIIDDNDDDDIKFGAASRDGTVGLMMENCNPVKNAWATPKETPINASHIPNPFSTSSLLPLPIPNLSSAKTLSSVNVGISSSYSMANSAVFTPKNLKINPPLSSVNTSQFSQSSSTLQPQYQNQYIPLIQTNSTVPEERSYEGDHDSFIEPTGESSFSQLHSFSSSTPSSFYLPQESSSSSSILSSLASPFVPSLRLPTQTWSTTLQTHNLVESSTPFFSSYLDQENKHSNNYLQSEPLAFASNHNVPPTSTSQTSYNENSNIFPDLSQGTYTDIPLSNVLTPVTYKNQPSHLKI